MAKFRAGKLGRTTVNSATVANKEWSVSDHGADLDTSNFESNGLEEGLIGLEGLDWTLAGLWDAGQNQFIDPPGLYPRDDGVALKLYTRVSDNNHFWNLPLWRCLNSDMRCSVDGLVSFDSKGKSNGTFTRPQGSV